MLYSQKVQVLQPLLGCLGILVGPRFEQIIVRHYVLAYVKDAHYESYLYHVSISSMTQKYLSSLKDSFPHAIRLTSLLILFSCEL